MLENLTANKMTLRHFGWVALYATCLQRERENLAQRQKARFRVRYHNI